MKPIVEKGTNEKFRPAAIELFANLDSHITFVDQIPRRVGFPKSLIYHYFESKDQLLIHIIEDFLARNKVRLPGESRRDFKNLDDLIDYLCHAISVSKIQSVFYPLLRMLTLQGPDKEKIKMKITEKPEDLLPRIHQFFEKQQVHRSQIETYAFSNLPDGILLHYLYRERSYPLDEVFDFFTTGSHRF